jgi:endonuclease V
LIINILEQQVILVDGNGILHNRGFGLASQLGVLLDIPTIGVGKTLLAVDGLNPRAVTQESRQRNLKGGDFIPLIGESGQVWGATFRATDDSVKPLFVSIGHRISLSTAVKVVSLCCKYFRIPAPIREADLRSRAFVRSYCETNQS